MYGASRRRGTEPRRGSDTNAESGQALLELALVVPLLVLLVMAIFQFAFVIQSQMGLTNAVREAARRVAAIEPNAPPAWTGSPSLTEWAQAQLCGDATPPCAGGLLEDNVQAFDATKLQPDPPVVTYCSYSVDIAGTPETQYRVQADVEYKHPVFFGVLAFATDLIDGTPDGLWDLSASAQMRLENIEEWETDPAFVDPGPCP